MNKSVLEAKAELIALGNYLTEYPDEWGFDQIIDLLLEGDSEKMWKNNILVWEAFDKLSTHDVARYIEDLKSNVVWRFTSEVTA